MELVVKLQLEGPCRIGLVYAQEYQAVKQYEALVSGTEGANYSLTLELLKEKDKLNLMLESDVSGRKTLFKDIRYSADQLKKLLIGSDLSKSFQYLHCFYKHNTLMLAKPFRSASDFIVLSRIDVLNPVNI